MAYTVLARRYRSTSFDTVVGQEAIAKTLTNAIASAPYLGMSQFIHHAS